MAVRSYRFSFGGSITVDDTTLKAAMLTFEVEVLPGVPDLTDEENLEIAQSLLNLMETLPKQRMEAFLVNGPLLHLDKKVTKHLRSSLPGVAVHLDGVTVAIEGDSR